jgi:hypothetical protein
MLISAHISLSEATYSRTAESAGIKNLPNLEELKNMRMLAMRVFEPLREHFNAPIRVNSFFRSLELNRKVGGSGTSQHCRGQAMDISSMKPSYSNADLFNYIRDHLVFDQLIWEFGNDENPDWVHVSFADQNRRQILKSVNQGGKTVYITI